MAQSRAARKGQKEGKKVPIGDAPLVLISSGSASIPSIGSGAATAASNVQGKQTQDPKYPLWKYVTREPGPDSKAKGGGNVAWKCSFCHSHFMSTYYRVKAHFLALPSCGISACTQLPLAKRKEMEGEAFVGAANVASKTKQNKNDDPLPFLRKSSKKLPFESSNGGQAAKRKATALGPMDKIFQKEKREELDLTHCIFFYQNFISFNVACSPLFIEMCRALTQIAPSRYVPPRSEKLKTTLLTKAKKEVDKMLEPIKSTWPTSRVSIVSDGWTNPARHPLINSIVSSLNGLVS